MDMPPQTSMEVHTPPFQEESVLSAACAPNPWNRRWRVTGAWPISSKVANLILVLTTGGGRSLQWAAEKGKTKQGSPHG